jgi:hypothetical protein
MAGKNTAAFGIYRDRASVENAVDMLRQRGFRNTDISVLFPHNEGTKDFATEKNTKAPEGTAAGAGTGAVIGGTLGWLAGIGALAIPGLGPFIAAGPIMAALAGVGVGGAIGGLTGALIGMGIPEFEAKRYEGRVSRRAGSCSPSIAMTRTGPRRQKKSSNTPVPRMSRPQARPRPTFRRPTSPCPAPARIPQEAPQR